VLSEVAGRQAGVFSRAQARDCGLTDEMIAANVVAGRWRRVVRGVYSLTTGPLTRLAVLWVALLRLGAGAVLSHETAAELWGLAGPSTPVHVTVPIDRPRRSLPGALVHRSSRIAEARHPARQPPRTTVEETVVDLTQTAPDLDTAAAWMASAVGARLTTPLRIAEALGRRTRVRWRRYLACILRDIAIGCHSLLELLYLRNVERAHALPPSRRQVRRSRMVASSTATPSTASTGRSSNSMAGWRTLSGSATCIATTRWSKTAVLRCGTGTTT
jgi:hypothetical protein